MKKFEKHVEVKLKHLEDKLDILFPFLERRTALNLIKYNKKAQNSLGVTKEDYINLSRSIRKKPLKSIAFSVDFNSIPGETVCVLGSIPEFGNWSLNGALFLGWNKGNIWKGERKIERDIKYFEFKFVIEEKNKIKWWQEGGNNKINLEEITKDGINKSGRYNNGRYEYNHENGTLLVEYYWPDYDSGYDS